MKILKILLLIVALNCITGCWHFKSRNLTGEFLDDCSDIEKIKSSMVIIFDSHHMYGVNNNVDSLYWDIRENDSTFLISIDLIAATRPNEIWYGGGNSFTISKKNCKIISHIRW